MVRYLRRSFYICRNEKTKLNDRIRQSFANTEADSLINKCKAVYLHTLGKRRPHFHDKLVDLLPPPTEDNNTPPTLTEPEFSRDDLVTDMTGSLSTEDLALLAKGPGFAIKPKFNERTKVDIQTQLCRLAYQIRWYHKREAQSAQSAQLPNDASTRNLPKFPVSNFTCVPPFADDETELALRGANLEIARLVNSISHNTVRSNLSKEDFQTLKGLRGKPLVYLPSDKGSEFCVIEETQYTKAGEDHLCDNTIYARAKVAASTIEKRVNSTWKDVCCEANISNTIQRSYMTNNSKLPEFYHLIKTHKAGPDIKIRPIIANHGGPTAKMAWLMTRVLKPLLTTFPAHLESSHDLIDAINRVPEDILRSHPYPISLDVNTLYTSVPAQEAIQALLEHIDNQRIVLPLTSRHISAILEVILKNTFFTFNDRTYKQVSGLPMGSSISGLLAITFMSRLENGPLANRRVALYKRYVDDCCLLTTDRAEAEEILRIMNRQHESIHFDLELPNNGVLKLLDFSVQVTEDGRASFNFYKKAAKKPLFVNYSSALPTSTKTAIVRNEINRICARSSSQTDRDLNIQRFRNVLKLNDYPRDFINRTTTNTFHRNREPSDTHFFYLRLPFLSDYLNSKIKHIFKKYNLPVRTYHRSCKLRYALKRSKKHTCALPNCPMSTSGLCLTTNCVYSLKCEKCCAIYVGSTIRPLHIRIREHYNTARSSVFNHRSSCAAPFKVSVLGKESDCTSLRIREALLIRSLHPSINSRQERDEFAGLLF